LPCPQFALEADGRGYRASSLDDVTLASAFLSPGGGGGHNSGGANGSRGPRRGLPHAVHLRFRAVQGVDKVLSLLDYSNVRCEADLSVAGDQMLEAAKQGTGNLSLQQLNLLEDWVEAVQADAQAAQWHEHRRRSDDASQRERLLLDPWRAAEEEARLQARVGAAVGEAIRGSGRGRPDGGGLGVGHGSGNGSIVPFDPEQQRRAKAKAALAMYHLSMKKRHYKGLRPSKDVLVPPTYWGSHSTSRGLLELEPFGGSPASARHERPLDLDGTPGSRF
jgi:hypothetical protein